MKNTLIAGAVVLAGLTGAFALNNNSESAESRSLPLRNTDYSAERSYSDYGDRDCGDFSSQSEAQEFYEDEGGPDSDYHGLDRDRDGRACESNKLWKK